MEVKILVPDSLEEVTLGQYQEYLAQTEGEEDPEIINRKLIEAFCGLEKELVDSIPLVEAEKLLETLILGFEKDYDLTTRFDLLDVDMGFVPKLDDMSLGEYIDVENYIGEWQDMHKAMAVLYRAVNFKKGDKYTIAPYKPLDELQDAMKEMPLSVTMGAVVFFYRLGTELSAATLNYIQEVITKDKDITYQAKMALEKSGVGINQFMHSLKETSEGLMRLPHSPYTNA